MVSNLLAHWGAELSPESHDESIRAMLGKASFTNARMTAAIESMLGRRCEELDLFYMIGLLSRERDKDPRESKHSMVRYAEPLLDLGRDLRVELARRGDSPLEDLADDFLRVLAEEPGSSARDRATAVGAWWTWRARWRPVTRCCSASSRR